MDSDALSGNSPHPSREIQDAATEWPHPLAMDLSFLRTLAATTSR